MPVSKVELFASALNVQPENPTLDITTDVLAGNPITYSIGTPYKEMYFWVRITDDSNNVKNASLGSYRTQDNTGPIITSTLAQGDPSVSVLELSYSISDASGQLSEAFVHIDTSAPADSATIRAAGVSKSLLDTTHSFTGLVAYTTYFVSVFATDAAGNETIETRQLATAADTTPPVLDTFALRAPVGAEGDPELVVVIELAVSDIVA